jgi:hypothetical protein
MGGLLDLISGMLANRRVRRLLRAAPSAMLGELAENTFARVAGTVETFRSRALEAPLSGRLCAYYSIVVLERSRGDARELASEQEGIPFMLRAADAHAVIDPAHALISSGYDYKRDTPLAGATDPELALIGRHRITRWDIDELLFREAILGIGERVVVYGAGMREPDPDAPIGEQGYRDPRATRLRFTGTARYPLVISDDPKSVRSR